MFVYCLIFKPWKGLGRWSFQWNHHWSEESVGGQTLGLSRSTIAARFNGFKGGRWLDCKSLDKLPISWCRISSINSIDVSQNITAWCSTNLSWPFVHLPLGPLQGGKRLNICVYVSIYMHVSICICTYLSAFYHPQRKQIEMLGKKGPFPWRQMSKWYGPQTTRNLCSYRSLLQYTVYYFLCANYCNLTWLVSMLSQKNAAKMK